ncbi:MAG TPA: FAD-dependent oxidoreductase, partial [Steroidobacteraceae bacterium]|nr:FAD-dependent oxidoreductase [Steroidobacteraceae bacterium]
MASELIPTRTVRRSAGRALTTIQADICVLGAGISGVAAALEAARLGRKVIIVDGAPALGGQAIGSIIGTLIGLYTHGPHAYQITHLVADDLIKDMTAEGSLLRMHRSTVTFQYDEVRLGRWMEQKIEQAGVQAVVGAVLTNVAFEGRRVRHIDFATRFGALRVVADGFIDSSGDATLSFEAGLPVREPQAPVYGSLNFLIEEYDLEAVKSLNMEEVRKRLASHGAPYGLVRHDGWLMHFPSKNFMLANITHFETPVNPLATASLVFEGR